MAISMSGFGIDNDVDLSGYPVYKSKDFYL